MAQFFPASSSIPQNANLSPLRESKRINFETSFDKAFAKEKEVKIRLGNFVD
jgi:hypothetical protein